MVQPKGRPERARAPFERLLREAIGRLASAELCESIIDGALQHGGLRVVPANPSDFGAFACGSLRAHLRETLGAEAAEAVIVDLSPAFGAARAEVKSSGVRRRERHSLAAPSADAPVVLIASAIPSEVDALIPLIRDRVKVVAAYDVFSLLSAAQRYLTSPITLLLADGMPAMQPSTLATLGRVLPPGTRIILFGEGGPLPEVGETTAEWRHLGAASIEEVAVACLEGLEPDEEPAGLTAPPPRVVVAHADAAWLARTVRALIVAGFDPVVAPDGCVALERCIEHSPELVVVGRELPTLDGAQLAALLSSRYGTAAPPVVLVTPEPLLTVAPCVVRQVDEVAEVADVLRAIREREL